MKKITFALALAFTFVFTACEYHQDKHEKPDPETTKAEVTKAADQYMELWNAKDMEALVKLTTTDGLYLGTDPSEIMDQAGMIEMFKWVFNDTINDYSYSVATRKVMLGNYGKSALVAEYITMPGWVSILQMRQTFQYVYIEDEWRINFISWSFIAKNEDAGTLDKALEE
tara:strand:+ start:72 stop:581 length:510 start_codon:yes stop_codon:yes gene_type:complete